MKDLNFLPLAVTSIGEDVLTRALLARFAEAHPKAGVDVTVADDDLDIAALG